MDEEAFLKKGWQRVVEISGLGKSPQFPSDLGSFRRKTEKIRKHPESPLNALRQLQSATTIRFRIFGCHGLHPFRSFRPQTVRYDSTLGSKPLSDQCFSLRNQVRRGIALQHDRVYSCYVSETSQFLPFVDCEQDEPDLWQ